MDSSGVRDPVVKRWGICGQHYEGSCSAYQRMVFAGSQYVMPHVKMLAKVDPVPHWAAAGISDSGISGFLYAARAGC